ncbi:WD40-repeat-containing domain protein [Lipomyces japonicus]|uniref:WD40-repeat-containing domain protein n=1 Tax=Lipomyces japonicus TaxID=56871 RepID=UPI0034CFE59A
MSEAHFDEEIHEDEEFIDPESALDVIQDDEEDKLMSDLSDDDQEEVEDEVIELSNNSTTYFDKHTDSIFLIATHPTLPLALSGGGDDTGYVWTTHSVPPKFVTQLSGHTDSLVTGGWSPDGEWLITGGMDGQVRIWRARSRGQKWEFVDSLKEVEEVTWIAFHPTQPIFAFGANDGSVWVYALSPKIESLSVLYAHSEATTAGAFIPASALGNASVENPEDEEINLLTVSEDGSLISWSIPTGVQNYRIGPQQFHFETPWISLSLHPSGTSAAIGSSDGKLSIVGVRTGSIIASLDVLEATGKSDTPDEEKSVEGISWSDTMGVLAVGLVAGVVCIFDTGSWRVRRTLEVGEPVTKVASLPGTTEVVSSAMDGIVRKWDVRSGEEIWRGTGHSSGILGFALADSGKTLITASDEGVSLIYK